MYKRQPLFKFSQREIGNQFVVNAFHSFDGCQIPVDGAGRKYFNNGVTFFVHLRFDCIFDVTFQLVDVRRAAAVSYTHLDVYKRQEEEYIEVPSEEETEILD